MQVKRAVGQGASALKYDVLTALLTLAAQDGGVDGRLALRLSVLITARYNWRSARFAVGQREIARLWGVTERTAKREMAAMKAKGWIVIARQPARGRVAEHRIVMDIVLQATMPFWPAVGSDFVARMAGVDPEPASNVVPLVQRQAPVADGSVWAAASARLFAQDQVTHGAWFAGLHEAGREGTDLILMAPTQFLANYVQTHFATRLLAAVTIDNPDVRMVRVKAQ